jgi:type IV pilus assembly protein PilW
MMRRCNPRRAAGFTLIEMMISLVIGTVIMLAVVSVQKAFESQRRTGVGGNDLDNAGAYAVAQIDSLVRSAGSGFAQGYAQTYGCKLYASKSGTTVLPAPGVFPSPFDNALGAAGDTTTLGGTVRVAPVVILSGNTAAANLNGGNGSSDVIMVMGGAGAEANVATPFLGAATSTTIPVQSSSGFAANDLLMLFDTTQATGPAPCQVNQVSSITAGTNSATLNLGGTSLADPTNPWAYSVDTSAVTIGNTGANYPTFQLIGVGANNQLNVYDLLKLQNTAPIQIADSVMEVHALYLIGSGAAPGYAGVAPTGATYGATALMSGSTAATTTLTSIKAIRIGLILKSPVMEKMWQNSSTWTHVAPPTLTLFSDVPDTTGTAGNLTYTRTLDPNGVCSPTSTSMSGNAPLPNCERDYRYRTLEITVPLRNNMLLS